MVTTMVTSNEEYQMRAKVNTTVQDYVARYIDQRAAALDLTTAELARQIITAWYNRDVAYRHADLAARKDVEVDAVSREVDPLG